MGRPYLGPRNPAYSRRSPGSRDARLSTWRSGRGYFQRLVCDARHGYRACSMRTLAAIANGFSDNLIHRAADVILKERRKLVLVVRESPLHDIHLENMLKLSRMGVVILPPVPAFYNHPQNLDDMINHVTMRILDQFDIHLDVMNRWDGTMLTSADAR